LRNKGSGGSTQKGKRAKASAGKRPPARFKGLTKAELLEELTRLERSNTRLKNSNARLKSCEREMEDLFALSMDMLCVASMTHFLKVNPAFERVLGYTEEELLGTPFIEFIHPDDVKPSQYVIEEKLRQGEPAIQFRNRYRCRDGSYRWLEWMVRPVVDKGLFYAVARDVTQQVEAQNQLTLHAEVMDNMAEGVMLSRVGDGKIVYANPTFERMFGYGPGGLAGKHVSVLNAPPDKDPVEVAGEIMNALEEHGQWSGELKNVRADGTTFWSHAHISGFRHHEHGDVWVTVQGDITKRREAEEELKATEARLRSVLEAALDVIFSVDREMNILSINRVPPGLSPEEAIGTNVLEYVAPEYRDMVRDEILKVMETGGSSQYEIIARGPHDVPAWYETSLGPVFSGEEVVAVILVTRDITKRKRAEEALRESGIFLETLMGSTSFLLAYLDRDFNFIKVNRTYAMAGRREEGEFVGRNHFDFYPHEENEAIFRQVVETGEPHFSYAKAFEHPDQPERGTTYWDWSLVPVKDGSGEVVGLVFSLNDVTERKLAEEALKEKEAFLSDIFRSIQDSIGVLDKDLTILMTNAYPEQWFAHKMPIVGRKCYEVYHDRTEPCESCPSIRTLNSGKPDLEVISLKGDDGATYWFETYTFPLYDFKTDRMSGVIEYVRNITERKRTEEALRQSEERLKYAQRVANLGFWDWNLATGELYCSDEAFMIFGYEPQEFVPTDEKFRRLVHPEDLEFAQGHVDAALNEDAEYNMDFRIITPSGEVRHLNAQGEVTRDAEGRPVRFMGTLLDISERKRMEEKLRQNLKEKEVLLQEIHHRVKNNLNVVVSLLGLQERTITDPGSRERFREGQARVMAIARLHEMLYRSGDFTRIDVREYLEGIAMEILSTYSDEGSAIDLHVEVHEADLMINDLIPCGLIVNELVTNSLKHAYGEEEGGAVKVSLVREEGEMVLMISDDGKGIPEEMDPVLANSLGLVIVPALARQLGGAFHLENRGGARAEVRFPARGPAVGDG
jgi:PAS domain S-box-containing protein